MVKQDLIKVLDGFYDSGALNKTLNRNFHCFHPKEIWFYSSQEFLPPTVLLEVFIKSFPRCCPRSKPSPGEMVVVWSLQGSGGGFKSLGWQPQWIGLMLTPPRQC